MAYHTMGDFSLPPPCTVHRRPPRVYGGTTAHNTQTLDDDARDHHTTGHTAMPYSTRRSHHQHTPGRAHSVHNNDSANHDAACSVCCCAARSPRCRLGQASASNGCCRTVCTVALALRAHSSSQPPSKGSLRGSKCTPLCNSQLPACKPIVCRRSQVSKSYIDAEQRHQRSSILDTCCMTPRARALSACMQ